MVAKSDLAGQDKNFAKQNSLDYIRLVEGGVLCRSKFARLFDSLSIKTLERNEINCKSWRCVRHREKWGRRWHMILEDRLKELEITLLVNLTTSEMYSHEEIFKALRMLMRRFRETFGPTEYLRVTEYNKKHTQPHFHFLFSCPDLKFKPMPAKFREPKYKNLSYPKNVYKWLKQEWGDCLEYYAPGKKRTSVVWCQPPGNAAAAGKYAVNYVTAKGNKNEEPDNTWRGRKLCYSKKFFEIPASKMWREILVRLFGEPDETDRFFWLPNVAERLPGETPMEFARNETLRRRYFEAKYYSDFGEFPVEPVILPDEPETWEVQLLAVHFCQDDTGQGQFDTG